MKYYLVRVNGEWNRTFKGIKTKIMKTPKDLQEWTGIQGATAIMEVGKLTYFIRKIFSKRS